MDPAQHRRSRLSFPILSAWAALVLALTLPAAVQQPPPDSQQARPSSEAPLDELELRSGDILRGRIQVHTADYVQIEVGSGMVVGFHPDRVREIRKAVVPVADKITPADWRDGDEWFSLVDDSGVAVGWLHSTLTRDDAGRCRLSEEWQFVQKGRRIAVTWLEQMAADGTPIACYYRERNEVLHRNAVTDELIVTARPDSDAGGLSVRRKDRDGVVQLVHPCPKGLTFPLAARASLRQQLRKGRLNTRLQVTVFDPSTLELGSRSYSAGSPRQIERGGRSISVRELIRETPNGRSAEWIDASARTIRREINGPSLVALPTTEASARNRAQTALSVTSPRLVQEPGGRFGIRLPDPLWTAVESSLPGRVAVAHGDGSRASLVWMDHMDQGLALSSATNQVLRWLQLLHEDVAWQDPARVRLQAWDAMRIQGVRRTGAAPKAYQVHVVRVPVGLLVLRVEMPLDQERVRANDLERLLAGLELDPRPMQAPAGGVDATPPAPGEIGSPNR